MPKINLFVQETNQTFSVIDFYENKTILITGVTGFIGKVLLEKLLRQCSNVKKIYVLIRPLKSKTPEERLQNIFASLPFINHQDKLNKIEAINGDITADDLGLSIENRNRLIKEVNVVFHSAATINFTGILNKFIQQNIYGTISILNLCKDCRNIESIVYVSTAYSNCHLSEIKEEVYPTDQSAANVEKYLIYMKQKYGEFNFIDKHEVLASRPNPYTWSKSIAEWYIEEHFQFLPIIICRPSIVINSYSEPFPGWADNIAGFSGISLLYGTGIAQQLIIDNKLKSDVIPVDFVANSLIICAAYRNSTFYTSNQKVVNLTSSTVNPVTWKEVFNNCDYEYEFPSSKIVRPVSKSYDNCYKTICDKIRFKIQIFNHYLFAYLFDVICMILGYKPFMIRLTKRMHKAMFELKHFTLKEWHFHCNNLNQIYNLVSISERNLFQCNVSTIDWKVYFKRFYLGCRKYLLNDPDSSIQMSKIRQKRLYLAYGIIGALKYLFAYWILKLLTFKFATIGLGLKITELIYYYYSFQFSLAIIKAFKNYFQIKN